MKRIMKKSLSMCLVFAITLGLFGCAGKKEETPASAPAEAPAKSEAQETRTVVDVLGREVEIPAVIETVASVNLACTRMIVYAGGVDKIVGVTDNEKMEFCATPCVDVNRDNFVDLPSVGSGWPNNEIYQEELVMLDPDAIIYFTREAAAADELQKQTEIPVLGVFATDFVTEDFAATMNFLGDVFGTKEHTDELIQYVNACIEDLNSRTENIPDEDKPTVYYGAVSFKGFNGIDATYAHYNPFEVIHAKNVADETGGNGSMIVEKEQVTTWDPDFIFINKEIPTLGILASDLETNPDFYKGLSAVQNGRVFSQGAYNCFYTNIDVSLLNAYYAATIIYPEQFADVNFSEKAAEILTMFDGEAAADYLDVLEGYGVGYDRVTMFD